jgi:diguanylate cyclase (GGDEF)-like protein
VAGEELQRRLRQGPTVGVLFGDLDGLKSVNDRDGHAAGDQAIRTAATALREAASRPPLETRWVGRLHGDEFLVLFWPRSQAAEERLQHELEHTWRTACPMISVGVALSRPGESARSVVRRAELAMYRHKAARKTAPRPPSA